MVTIAEAIVATGLRDLGYVNLCACPPRPYGAAADPLTPDGGCRAIDGGWESFNRGGLNASGYPTQPGGWDFRNLTSFYHSQGLKLGMCASPDRCRPPL